MAHGMNIQNNLQSRPATGKPLYLVIVDDIIQKIHDGHYAPGDRIESLGDVCAHYDVAMATAHRSMGELSKLGVIKTIPRKGAFVVGVPAPPQVEQSAKVQRVILVEAMGRRRDKRSSSKEVGFTDPAMDAITRVCRFEQLPLEFQFIPVDSTAAQRVFFTLNKGDAIIAVGCGVSISLLSHLVTPNVPSVLIDAAAHNVNCVLTDNYNGMYQVVRHLHEAGHRRIAMAVFCSMRHANTINENERRDAMLHHAEILGMKVDVVNSGDMNDLFKAIDRGCTAVAFTRDDPALKFIEAARSHGLDVPGDVSVVGFDDWAQHAQGHDELTTVHVDSAKMGQVATEMILSSTNVNDHYHNWHRVKPQLVVRKTVGPPSGKTMKKAFRAAEHSSQS